MASDHQRSRPASDAAGRPGHAREKEQAVASNHPSRPGSRHATLTVLVDLIGPIALYYGLRAAGAEIFLALIIGAAAPALNAAIKLIRDRQVDGLALGVLAIMLLSTAAALIGGSPRFLLAKDGWLTAAWGAGFFASLRGQRPLTFLFARPLLEGRRVLDPATRRWSPPTKASWDDLWEQVPRFRRVWQVATMIWGIGTLIDAVIRLVMAYTLPVNVVPGLGGALWPVTFIALQVITNIYFARSGLWLILLGEPDSSQQPGDTVKPPPAAVHTPSRPPLDHRPPGSPIGARAERRVGLVTTLWGHLAGGTPNSRKPGAERQSSERPSALVQLRAAGVALGRVAGAAAPRSGSGSGARRAPPTVGRNDSATLSGTIDRG